jgi:hypothetical protein
MHTMNKHPFHVVLEFRQPVLGAAWRTASQEKRDLDAAQAKRERRRRRPCGSSS